MRCGTLAEHAAVTVPTCRQHWRPVMTVALKAHKVSGSMLNFVEEEAGEHEERKESKKVSPVGFEPTPLARPEP